MVKDLKFWPFLAITVALTGLAITATAQPPFPIVTGSVVTGVRPLGMDIAYLYANYAFAVVANSGENSVSIIGVESILRPIMKLSGIPSPYAVAACPSLTSRPEDWIGTVLVTSPSDNSVRVLQLRLRDAATVAVAGTLQVGPQPHSIHCFLDRRNLYGVVSNAGDNSLVVFDVATLRITAAIPNVPASRGFHGIRVIGDSAGNPTTAVVAGTEANVVTVVSLANSRSLTQIPVARPTAIADVAISDPPYVAVASAANNEILVYDSVTFARGRTYQNVPDPQDLAYSSVPPGFATSERRLFFAANSGQDSLSYWREGEFGTPSSLIPGIPGATALAVINLVYLDNRRQNATAVFTMVLVTSTTSNSVYLVQLHQPAVPGLRIANGASFAPFHVSPGSLASVFGVSTGVSQSLSVNSPPLPTTLGGVALRFGGTLSFNASSFNWEYSAAGSVLAPLLFVGPNQINFQIPPGISPALSVPLQVISADGAVRLTTVYVQAATPGIFTVLQSGQGQAAALNEDNSQNGNPQALLGARPAARGSVIQIFATGAGATNPPLLPGEPAPASGNPLVLTQVQPTVTIGGLPARVLFSGLAPGFVGLWQINTEIPQDVTLGPAVPMSITAGGVASNTVTIAVQ